MRGLEGRKMGEIEGEGKRRNMNRGGSKRDEEEGGSIGSLVDWNGRKPWSGAMMEREEGG